MPSPHQLALFCLLLFGCGNPTDSPSSPAEAVVESEVSKNEDKPKETILVRTTQIILEDIEKSVEAVANTQSLDRVDVIPERAEPVLSLLAEEGDQVKKGQVLAELRKEVAKLALDEASVQLAEAENEVGRAERDLERNRKLSEQGNGTSLLSERDLDTSHQALLTARTSLESARVGADRAELDLMRCTLRAPIAGTVTAREISVGDMTAIGTRAFEIVDLSKPRLVFYRPQRELSQLLVGQPIEATSEALPGATLTGKLERISPVVDAASGTIKVTALLDDQWQGLPTGILVRLRVVLAKHLSAALIPKKALLYDADRVSCFVIEDGIAKLVSIELGFENPNYVEAVESGFQGGEAVVIVGADRLEDGDSVEVTEE